MPGLLGSLESLFSSSGIESLVSGAGSNLGNITSMVTVLIDGPAELTSLTGAADALPAPPSLGGIGVLTEGLSSFSLPSDLSSPLSPILGPIENLTETVAGLALGGPGAILDLIRQIIKLTTGRTFGGPLGMPSEMMSRAGMPDLDAIRAGLSEARISIEALGPRIDAEKIFELLLRGSGSFKRTMLFIPDLPILGDLMEELGSLAAWKDMSGPELTADLTTTLMLSRDVINLPQSRVVAPIVNATAALREGTAWLSSRGASIQQAIAASRRKVMEGNGKAAHADLVLLEQAGQWLRKCAESLTGESPLLEHQDIPENLTRTLLSSIRTFESGFSTAPLAEFIREKIALIPAAPDDPFSEVIQAIEDFDLSAITSGLQSVTDAVTSAVNEVNAAREAVKNAFDDLLSPAADGLDALLASARIADIQVALQGLPEQVSTFVTNEIQPNIEPVRNAVENAVNAVSGAADSFDPAALVAPIRDAIHSVAQVINTDEVHSMIAQLDEALRTAIQALESIDLSGAAGLCVEAIGGIESKIHGIDPNSIPDAAKPVIRQAVTVVIDVDFSGDVAAPIVEKGVDALEEGAGTVLNLLEEGVNDLRDRLNAFKPSQLIGDVLDKPFNDLIDALQKFKPSDLLGRLQEALNQVAERMQVLDVGAVVDPLIDAHGKIKDLLEDMRPSKLLKPVNDAIEDAIDKLYEVTGVDAVLEGLDEILEFIQSFTGLLRDVRDLCATSAALFENPGDSTASVNALIDEVLVKFGSAEWTRIAASLDECRLAVQKNTRDQVLLPVADSLEEAARLAPEFLGSPIVSSVTSAARDFPLDLLRAFPKAPMRTRLISAIETILAAASQLEAAKEPWRRLAPEISAHVLTLQEELLDYYNLLQSDQGGPFGELLNPPANADALAGSVRAALEDGVKQPVEALLAAFSAVAPYLRILGDGLGRQIGAIEAKMESITGSAGLGGNVHAIEDAANLLRTIDLSLITDSLDALFGRFETAIDALDPTPLKQALEAARDAVAGLLNVTTLISRQSIDALNETYADAVEKIAALTPGKIIAETLDPEYDKLLADILPVLDLPIRLRELVETAGRNLSQELESELSRVEASFNAMLRAIPQVLGEGGAAAVSASASVSVN